MMATARPYMEDVTSQAKILGHEHEKPLEQTRQAKELTVWPMRYIKGQQNSFLYLRGILGTVILLTA
eukprot:1426946-Ditylum_brightwellii.AAC.1